MTVYKEKTIMKTLIDNYNRMLEVDDDDDDDEEDDYDYDDSNTTYDFQADGARIGFNAPFIDFTEEEETFMGITGSSNAGDTAITVRYLTDLEPYVKHFLRGPSPPAASSAFDDQSGSSSSYSRNVEVLSYIVDNITLNDLNNDNEKEKDSKKSTPEDTEALEKELDRKILALLNDEYNTTMEDDSD